MIVLVQLGAATHDARPLARWRRAEKWDGARATMTSSAPSHKPDDYDEKPPKHTDEEILISGYPTLMSRELVYELSAGLPSAKRIQELARRKTDKKRSWPEAYAKHQQYLACYGRGSLVRGRRVRDKHKQRSAAVDDDGAEEEPPAKRSRTTEPSNNAESSSSSSRKGGQAAKGVSWAPPGFLLRPDKT